MTLTLKDPVDLSAHAYRYKHGWIKLNPDAAVPTPASGPKGKHLVLQTEPDRYRVTEDDPQKIAADIDRLVADAQGAAEGSTEWEHAWSKVATHVDALNAKAKANVRGKPQAGLTRKLAAKPKIEAKVKVTDTAVKDTAIRVRDEQILRALTTVGLHVAGAVGGVLGTEQAIKFSETFQHLAENQVFEAGLLAVVVLAMHALITKIRQALAARKDRKIKAAREASKERLKTEGVAE